MKYWVRDFVRLMFFAAQCTLLQQFHLLVYVDPIQTWTRPGTAVLNPFELWLSVSFRLDAGDLYFVNEVNVLIASRLALLLFALASFTLPEPTQRKYNFPVNDSTVVWTVRHVSLKEDILSTNYSYIHRVQYKFMIPQLNRDTCWTNQTMQLNEAVLDSSGFYSLCCSIYVFLNGFNLALVFLPRITTWCSWQSCFGGLRWSNRHLWNQESLIPKAQASVKF